VVAYPTREFVILLFEAPQAPHKTLPLKHLFPARCSVLEQVARSVSWEVGFRLINLNVVVPFESVSSPCIEPRPLRPP